MAAHFLVMLRCDDAMMQIICRSLTSAGTHAELDAAKMRLNQAPTPLANADAILPSGMAGAAQMESAEMELEPRSYGFTQFRQVVGVAACAEHR